MSTPVVASGGRVECIVCGGAEGRPQFVKWDDEIVRCDGCGLGRAQLPPGFEPRAIYTEDYFQGGRSDGYADYRGTEPVLRAEFQRTLGQLARAGIRGGRLLEIGCAYGFFLDEARASFDAYGVDVAEAAIASCRERGLNARVADPEGRWLDAIRTEAGGDFDAVVLLDVIEHLEDPGAAIAQAASVLRPGGVVLITTGDWASPVARVMGRHWRLMTPPQHLYYFSAENLARLVARHGFEPVLRDRPWKVVPAGLALYQVLRSVGLQRLRPAWLDRVAVPVNLFDTVRLIARRVAPTATGR
jgi:2-polyprenyl-3-methyl-5-hydroxy-6-metoxy-1,4-benzoquinol methylase